jgi:hypothetical protein
VRRFFQKVPIGSLHGISLSFGGFFLSSDREGFLTAIMTAILDYVFAGVGYLYVAGAAGK